MSSTFFRRRMVDVVLQEIFPPVVYEDLDKRLSQMGFDPMASKGAWAGLRESALLWHASPGDKPLACPSYLTMWAWETLATHPEVCQSFCHRAGLMPPVQSWLSPEDSAGRARTLAAWAKLQHWGVDHIYGVGSPLIFDLDRRYGHTECSWWKPGQPLSQSQDSPPVHVTMPETVSSLTVPPA